MRLTAPLIAGALVATALTTVGLASPASAAAPTLAWQISQQFDDHLSTHELGDGATESADGVVTFPGGTGSVDAETGAGTVTYDGWVAGSFVFAGVTQYTITLADPAVTVDADGTGEITAVVSSFNIAGMGSPDASTDPARVTVTTFDAEDGWGSGTITATPDWAGVLPPGAESAALGIPGGKPVDGKSFAPAFLAQITSGTRPHFYASGASSDAKKSPGTFTASAVESMGVTVTTSYGADAVRFDVTGSGGFTSTDGNPGDDGVYIGLAPSGGLPSVDDMGEDFDTFAAANWVPGSAITDGGFASTMTAKAADLDRDTDYSVYTWRAHEHSTTSQDTETPVTIDWSQVRSPVSLKLDLVKRPTTTKGGTLAVKAGTATGKVTVRLTRNGKAGPASSATLKAGKARLRLPKLAKGTWKATVSYAGSDSYAPAKKSLKFTV